MPEPFYERDGHVIFLGDCRDVLPALPKGSADLLVTDPPYGVGYQSGWKDWGKIAGDDDASWVPDALDLALDVLRKHRHAYVFGPEALLPERLTARTTLIWDKGQPNMGRLDLPWAPSHEPINFSVFVPSKANRECGRGRGAARLRQASVLRFPRHNGSGATRHPTEKPVPLLRRLIESSSLVGEVVLDPFVGSGSTSVAAALEGRKSIGIELDERYAATAAERLDEALDWLALAPPDGVAKSDLNLGRDALSV